MFGDNMRYLRKENGLSLKQVEEKTGIDDGNLSRYERNLNVPSIELCIKLANLYMVSLDELIGRTDELRAYNMPSNSPPLSPEEQRLLNNYHGMRPDLKRAFLDLSETWGNSETASETANKKKA